MYKKPAVSKNRSANSPNAGSGNKSPWDSENPRVAAERLEILLVAGAGYPARRRRNKPRPTKALPTKASVPGSGTESIVNVALPEAKVWPLASVSV